MLSRFQAAETAGITFRSTLTGSEARYSLSPLTCCSMQESQAIKELPFTQQVHKNQQLV